jgi:hypothetical protein
LKGDYAHLKGKYAHFKGKYAHFKKGNAHKYGYMPGLMKICPLI